jgi:hypothetical protein
MGTIFPWLFGFSLVIAGCIVMMIVDQITKKR